MTTPTIEVFSGPPAMPTFQSVGGDRYHISVGSVATMAADIVIATIMYDTLSRPDQSVTGVSSPTLGNFTFHSITPFIPNGPAGVDPGMVVETWYAVVPSQLTGETVTVTIGGSLGADSAFCAVFGVTNTASPYFDDLGGSPLIDISPSTGGADPTVSYSTGAPNELVIAIQGAEATGSSGSGAPNGSLSYTALPITPNNYNGRQLGLTISSAPAVAAGAGSITSTVNTASFPNSFLVAYALLGPITSATVPDIVGLLVPAGEAALTAALLTTGTTTQVASPEAPGTILTQSIPAGTVVSLPQSVDFTYAQGLPVPNVVNTSLAVVAPGILAAAGFAVGPVTYATSGTVTTGNVISQSPAAGSYAAGGSGVALIVSSGLPPLTVPDLFGLTQTDAINLLLSLGLVPGAIGSAPSQFVPPGEVQTQNPSPGQVTAVGSIVSFVLSLGTPAVGAVFDFEATVISQYANSPTIIQLVKNLNQYIDQSANFANFFNFVWNVDTAVGFGLDIWGKIVGVSRLLQIPNTTKYVGFYQSSESQPSQDWTPAGSDQPPYNAPPVGGAMYTGHNATEAYLLPDDAYRQLILAKAFANIAATTAPALNQLLQNIYGGGTAFVLNVSTMHISYNLTFTPTAIQLAILEQSGVIPTPPGVAVTINTNVV